jgi:hypothetical protein
MQNINNTYIIVNIICAFLNELQLIRLPLQNSNFHELQKLELTRNSIN